MELVALVLPVRAPGVSFRTRGQKSQKAAEEAGWWWVWGEDEGYAGFKDGSRGAGRGGDIWGSGKSPGEAIYKQLRVFALLFVAVCLLPGWACCPRTDG